MGRKFIIELSDEESSIAEHISDEELTETMVSDLQRGADLFYEDMAQTPPYAYCTVVPYND